MESLENLSPAVLASVGMLSLNTTDVSWPLLVDRWLGKRSEREEEVLRELCARYIGPTLAYLSCKSSVPPASGAPPTQSKPCQLRHVVPVTEMGMVNTLLTLVEVRSGTCSKCSGSPRLRADSVSIARSSSERRKKGVKYRRCCVTRVLVTRSSLSLCCSLARSTIFARETEELTHEFVGRGERGCATNPGELLCAQGSLVIN